MIRKARIEDVKEIQKLINYFAKLDLMLPRSLNELYENLRDFWIFKENNRVLGCCALRICWEDLAEIKSLAVQKKRQRQGIGKKLVDVCIKEARELGAKKVFILTYKPDYFKQFGFKGLGILTFPIKYGQSALTAANSPIVKKSPF